MILPFSKIGKNDAQKAGGKGASLGEMTQAGIPVPRGFVVLAEAFEAFLDTNSLRSEINQILGNIDHNSVTSIEGASEKIQELIKNGQIPSEIKKEIQKYQETLDATFVAVRSSATAEDGAEHAWAGQLDTYLNVAKGDVEKKIQSCWASLFTPRALFYRSEKGLGELHISVAVVVQSMVDAESAGVAFSVHPVTENHDEIVIEGSWGLGEAVVSGEVTPDSFVISKSGGNTLSEHIAEKKKGIFRNKDGQNEWLEIDTEKREKPILTKEKIQKLSELIIQIENHYGFPCDIEWAHSKEKIYILQARPITTLHKQDVFIENKYQNITEKEYDFLWTVGFPYIYCSMFLESGYQDIDTISYNKGNSYTQFIGKSDRKILSQKGLNLYLRKYDEYEKKIKEKRLGLEERFKYLESKNIKEVDTSELKQLFKNVVDLFIEVWSDYFVTEYHHTDELGKFLEDKNEDADKKTLQRNIEKMGHLKLFQREFINKFMYEPSLIYKYLNEVNSRFNLSCNIEWYSYHEVLDILNGKDVSVPNREKGVIRGKFSNWNELLGEECDKIYKQLENINTKITQIKGQIGNKGKYTGKVKKIAFSIETNFGKEIEDMVQGQVLVSGSTGPEMILACKKAGAIITDEGGIISHAAIISRELKIPSIIGTKIATKVLEDGDMVEVDANNGVVRVLEKKKNIFTDNWQLGATRNMPLWHDILCLYGWEDNMRDYGVDEKCKCLFVIENATHATMFMLPENQKKYFTATAECCKNGKAVRELRKKYERYAAEVQHDLKKLAEKQNEKNWQKFFKSYQRFTAGLWITTGFGRIGTEKLEQELTKSGIQKEKIPEYIGLITYPEEHTPLFLSQRDMLIIGNKIQKNKKTDTKKELQKWLEKHKYIPVNYCEDPWTLADVQEHLTNILEQDCEIALQKLEISHEKKIQARKKLGKKYGKNIREIGDALAEATSLNEYRKNIFCRLSYSIRYIFETIMRQVGSSDWRDAYYCTPEEILAIAGGESIDIQSIKDERKKCVFVREGDTITWGDTEQVQKFFGKIYNTPEAISETLQGFSANTGKITGTVKIVLSTKDFYKVQRGDILVTTMTSVDFVPIMEKAGAFVTNEGGITSHAAIVAREMDKPCIIGTKHATRMLKDGDLVEVDADNGVVKILKNNSEPDFSHKNLEVWIERKQSIFSMSVFHELESEVMKQHLGGGFRTQICFMKDKICSYIHEIGDFENVVNAIAKTIKNSSEQEIREMIEKMNSWEKIGKKIIKEGHTKVMISKASRKKYLENYKNIGYWTTVVPYFLLEAINTIENQTAYKNLKTVCERLRSNSLYPILNEEITHKILEELTDTIGLEKGDWYYITWHETIHILEGNTPQNIESIKKRKNKKNAFYRSKNGEVIFLENKENIQNLSEISYPKNTINIINGTTAYPGKVQGKVKILRTTNDMRDFEQGDILVSPNSNPSLMPCIKKCGAMITDEGGVSCHAAIISRELRKPCIIGTKIATKFLKDGDMVEVDGETGKVKILEKKREIQWGFTYDRQMSYQRIELFHCGYCEKLSKYFDVSIENELYRIKKGLVSVFYDKLSHKEAFTKIRGLLTGKNSKKWYQRIHRTITEDYKKFISFLDKKEEKESGKNLGEELQAYMNQNRDISLSTWLLYGYIEEILSDVLKDLVQKKINSNWEEVFDILSHPDEIIPADSWEYDMALACVATESEKEKKTKEIYTKYRSYGMYDVMFEGKTPKAIDKKIKDQSSTAHEIIKKIENKYSLQKNALKKIQKIDWNETEKVLIKLYRLYANFKDWKNFHRERSSYQIQEIYENIAQKFHIKTEVLWYMTADEIGEGIQKNRWISEVEIEKRKTNSAWIFTGISTKNITDRHELGQLDGTLSVKKNILQGNTAYPGKIRGKARIINSPTDLENIVTGEILISSTTRPDYLPFMSKIAGFITNEGGTLSHAAILAREIKKPCIIGTKVATQVIKTGQTITLDATAGTATIEKDDYFDDKKLLSEGGRACYLYPNRIFCTRMNIPHPLWENHLMVISTSENHKVNWYFAVNDESEFDYTLERVLKKPNMLEEGEEEINKLVQKAEKTLEKEYKHQKEAGKGYENFIKIYEEIAIVPTFVRQLDRAVVRSLREVITNEEDFAVATYPTKRTYQRQEEVLLLELRTRMGEEITPDVQQNLHEIYSTYFTSGLGYFEEQVKTMENYEERLLGISKEEAGESLKKIQTEEKEMIRKKKELKKNLREKADVIDIAGFLVYLKDHYKFQINRVQYYSEGLWKSMADITGYTENFLRDLTPEEIQNLIQNNTIDEEAIKERIACHAYVYNEQGEPELIIGKKAQDFIQMYLKTNNEQKEFGGRVACKGHGIGKAKIILGTRDFHKMEQGDILVVMNTSPDFVPIMKKAAAIVAEEGGITGHVSVVSREFGIPSVVGIKQITSIIQDGEIIEVDAERGVVIRHN